MTEVECSKAWAEMVEGFLQSTRNMVRHPCRLRALERRDLTRHLARAKATEIAETHMADALMTYVNAVLSRVLDQRPDIALDAAMFPTTMPGFSACHLQFRKADKGRSITRPVEEIRSVSNVVAYAQFWADDMIAQMGP